MKWPHVRIGDVCDLNPRLPKTHTLNDDDAVSFVPMAAVSELSGTIQTRSTRRFAEVRKGYTPFQNNDVLFAKITPCMENGKAAIARDLVHGYGFGSTEFHVLRASENVLPEWLHFFVRQATFRHEAKRNFTGTGGQQRVPATFVANTLIPLPPLPEQRRIVDLLTRAEGIVRLRREAADKAAELIPAIFIDMFGDPAQTPVSDKQKIGDLLQRSIRNGISPSKSGRYVGRVLTLSAITRGRFNPEAIKESTFDEPISLGDSVSNEDFLVCRGNGNKSLVGAGCFPTRTMADVAFPDTAIAIRPNLNILAPSYLEALWKTSYLRQQIDAIAKTTNGTFKINQSGLASIVIPVPSMDLQLRFGEQVDRVQSILSQQSEAEAKAQATFNALVAQAFAPHGSL